MILSKSIGPPCPGLLEHSILDIRKREKGLRQVIMALILWATDVPHMPKQRDAKTEVGAKLKNRI